MDKNWLKIINIVAIPAILGIVALFWLYKREQFAWGIYLAILALLLVAYLNVRKPILDYIEARTRAKNKPADAKAERRLKAINYLAFIAVFVIGVVTWVFLPRGQFMWSIICMILILVVAGLANIRKIVSDIS